MSAAILSPGRNVWRIERASRATVLIDGAAIFGGVRDAFLRARRSIFIVGWDIDSRTRLVGTNPNPDDGFPANLVDLLTDLVLVRPELQVYLLLWDFSLFYANERELFPRLSLQWSTPPNITLCLDDAVPFGSSQHQKLIVVDDALAFSGGLDLTLRRWDTCEHRPDNPHRVDASGVPYPPFHDVQIMVDGPAAQALAQLARRRWCRANQSEPPLEPFGDPWPSRIAPHFKNVEIGISRTEPPFEGHQEVREVEALYFDAIRQAQRFIYLENQFMTSLEVARRLAQRLRESPLLEVLAICPKRYESWVVSTTLGAGRSLFAQIVSEAAPDRVRFLYPLVSEGAHLADTKVHSKVMIVDDQLLRIGSANLNNRSMGVDTECDIVIEAKTNAERDIVRSLRDTLLGHHCGLPPEAVASSLVAHGSLIYAADHLSEAGHRLCAIEDIETPESTVANVLGDLADPKHPIKAASVTRRIAAAIDRRSLAIIGLGLALLLLTLVWHFTPLSEIVTREQVQTFLSAAAESSWAPFWVVLVYLGAGSVAFPVLALIVATVAVFGPWLGFCYALLGVLASALWTYFIGAWLGRKALRARFGSRLDDIRSHFDKGGIIAVAAVRLVPAAPFSLVNVAAGACSVSLLDFVAGTILGMLPGLIGIAVLGYQVTRVFSDISARDVLLLVALLGAWLALIWVAQHFIKRIRKPRP